MKVYCFGVGKTVFTLGLLCVVSGAQSAEKASHGKSSELKQEAATEKAIAKPRENSIALVSGHTLTSVNGDKGYTLKNSKGEVVVYARSLDELRDAIAASEKIATSDKTALNKQLQNKTVIENFLAGDICRRGSKKDVMDIEVKPTDELIELMERMRKGQKLTDDTEVSVSLNTINDNLAHGLGRQAGLKKGSTFEGDDQGLTFGTELNALVEKGNDSFSLTLLDHLYTKSVADNSRTADGAWNQQALDKSAINLSVVKGRDINGRDAYFFRFEGEMGCETDRNGISSDLQKIWHDVANGKKLNDVEHMDRQFYAAGKLGVGRRTVLRQDGTTSLSALMESGVQGRTATGEDNAVYCSTKLQFASKFCELEVFADVNSSGHYKIGGAASKAVYKGVKATAGAYYKKDELTKGYGDDDLIHELGLRVGF